MSSDYLQSSNEFLKRDFLDVPGVEFKAKVNAKEWINNVHKVIEGSLVAALREGTSDSEIVLIDSSKLTSNYKVLQIKDIDDITRGLSKYARALDIMNKNGEAMQKIENAHRMALTKMEAQESVTQTIADIAKAMWNDEQKKTAGELDQFAKRIDQEVHAAKKIQQRFRKHTQAKVIKETNAQQLTTPELRLQEAIRVAESLRTKFQREDRDYYVDLSPFTREPIVNPEKTGHFALAREKFVKLVSAEKFNAVLRSGFEDTLTNILSQPPDKRAYIIIGDDGDKSTNWVVSQLLDLMGTHPPHAIVKRANLKEYLANHPDVANIVMIDDGAYSGEQACGYIERVARHLVDKHFHVCIPYMTRYAEKRLIKTLRKLPHSIARHQRMLSFNDLASYSLLGYGKVQRPCLQIFISTPLLEGSPEQVDELNGQLVKLKKEIFKIPDDQIISRIESLIDEVESSGESAKEPLKTQLETLKEALYESLEPEERGGISPELKELEPKAFYRNSESKTGTWMAHKSADYASVDMQTMNKVTGGKTAIEPYKSERDDERSVQVAELESKNPELSRQWLEAIKGTDLYNMHVVSTNRGVFFLADNYIAKPKDNQFQVILIIDSKRFPFGGTDGAFQWKLENGMQFCIEQNGATRSFLFQNEQINSIGPSQSSAEGLKLNDHTNISALSEGEQMDIIKRMCCAGDVEGAIVLAEQSNLADQVVEVIVRTLCYKNELARAIEVSAGKIGTVTIARRMIFNGDWDNAFDFIHSHNLEKIALELGVALAAKKDFSGALRAFQVIPFLGKAGENALDNLIRDLCSQHAPARVLDIVAGVHDVRLRDRILHALIQVAYKIDPPAFKTTALISIADQLLKKGNWDKVEEIAEKLPNKVDREALLQRLAMEKNKGKS